jgi:hypothetical protein
MNDSTIVNVSKVVGVNAAAVTSMFTHLNEFLTALTLSLSAGYTLYKILQDIRKKKP